MDDFKEFQGSDLDNAIKQACTYYNANREKLEIDIIQDSKTGIFGIVGARKAKIKARKVLFRSTVGDILGDGKINDDSYNKEFTLQKDASASGHDDAIAPTIDSHKKYESELTSKHSDALIDDDDIADSDAPTVDEDEIASYGPGNELPKNRYERSAHRRDSSDIHRKKSVSDTIVTQNIKSSDSENLADVLSDDIVSDDIVSDGLTLVSFESLDQENLKSLCFDAVKQLTSAIVGEVPIYVEIVDGRINVILDCGDDSGLLIGREGQTLASIQYLASRVVSRQTQAAIRIQIDAGDYRLRQDEKLKSVALALAERVKATGRACSTRPLSSYHRRIVHMALQESLEVQTRSSGDGALKRVIIQRKRG